jgi:hypothetical protein
VRAFVVVVVVLLLAALGADRVAEHVTTDRAETRLASEGVTRPQVDVSGFPFLTQLLDRRFPEVRLTASGLATRAGRARRLVVSAHDVSLPQQGQATAGSVRATGFVTYAEVLRRSGANGVDLEPAGDGKVRLRGDAQVLEETVPVAAVGRVTAAGREIRIEPTRFEADGVPVDSAALLDALGARFTLVYRLRELPRGLRVADVEPGPTGFRVVVTGSDVTLPTGD